MKITLSTASNVDRTKAMRLYLEQAATCLDEITSENDELYCFVKISKKQKKVRLSLKGAAGTIRSEVTHRDFYEAVDITMSRLKENLLKKKERTHAKRYRKEKPHRIKAIRPEMMSVEEAAEFMRETEYGFYLFVDEMTEQPSLVYEREDGGYGLIRTNEEAEEAEINDLLVIEE